MATRDLPQLDYRTCVTQVERALVARLSLGLRERVPAAADKPALRRLDAQYRQPGDLVFVESVGRNYCWDGTSEEPDNDDTHIQSLPWVTATGKPRKGRWVRSDDMSIWASRQDAQGIPLAAFRTGYLRSVELYQGRPDTEELWKRFTGRRPCLAVRYGGDQRRLKNGASSIYRVEMNFQLIGLSFHPRRGAEALEGSDLPQEAGRDPGLFQILGDADDLVQGRTHPQSGYWHLVPGVVKVLPGGHQIIQELQAQRLYIGAVNITVVCDVHRPDRDTVPLKSIGLTTVLASQGLGQPLDPENVVLSGLSVPWPQSTLLAAPEPGRVRVGGQEFEISPSVFTFAPSADTYRYITPAGELRYESVDEGAPAPAVPAGWLAVGKTTTGTSGIVFDQFLCALFVEESQRDVETVQEGEELP